ncbi:MAG: NAD(P)H-hydrate epimerase [Chloroflexota bacterium]
MKIPMYEGPIPYISTDQMIEVDRAMMEDYQISLIQMMENAGRNLAHLARDRFLQGNPTGKTVVILAGTGGNGGGALVCARRLHNYGAKVQIFLSKPDDQLTPVPAHQLDILRRMKLPVFPADTLVDAKTPDLVVDGIIGYSLKGSPRGSAEMMIRWANDQPTPTLSLDAPSGVDTTSGTVYDPAIQAVATMTLALPKAGLRKPGVEDQVGELYLADISVPPELYAGPALKLDVEHLFATSDIIRLL